MDTETKTPIIHLRIAPPPEIVPDWVEGDEQISAAVPPDLYLAICDRQPVTKETGRDSLAQGVTCPRCIVHVLPDVAETLGAHFDVSETPGCPSMWVATDTGPLFMKPGDLADGYPPLEPPCETKADAARIYLLTLRERIGQVLNASSVQEKEIEQLRFRVAQLERDSLSGLYRREIGEPLLMRLPRQFAQGLVVVIDIDDLKRHNLRGSLSAGDRAVQIVSDAIAKNLRAADIGVRWAGDEFVIGLACTAGTKAGSGEWFKWAPIAAGAFCRRVMKDMKEASKDGEIVTITCASSVYYSDTYHKKEWVQRDALWNSDGIDEDGNPHNLDENKDRPIVGSVCLATPMLTLRQAVDNAHTAIRQIKAQKKADPTCINYQAISRGTKE